LRGKKAEQAVAIHATACSAFKVSKISRKRLTYCSHFFLV